MFGVLVVVALGYMVWAQNSDPDATDYSATSVKKTETKTETAATDETADWKTHSNQKFGYSFKYPPTGWFIHSQYSNLDFRVVDGGHTIGGDTTVANYAEPAGTTKENTPDDMYSLHFKVYRTQGAATLEEFTGGYDDMPSATKTDVTVSGLDALKLSWPTRTDAPKLKITLIKGEDKFYEFNYSGASIDKAGAIFEQIINSFKVT